MITEKEVKSWIVAKIKLDIAKKQEGKLRQTICEHILKGRAKGSKKETVGKFILTATAKLNEKINLELFESSWSEFTPEEKNCIRFKPSIKAKEFHKLKDSMLLHRAIDSKPGMPALVVKGEEL